MSEPFSGYTGRGVKIAIIDSGVNPAHPHVGGVAGGVRIGGGMLSGYYLDYNGHGTAVAGVIREKAPDALLYAVKVFDHNLKTNVEALIWAIEWAVEHEIMVVNLSLGTNNEVHRERLARVVELATRQNTVIVSAHSESGRRLYPGSLPQVVGVVSNGECRRDTYIAVEENGETVFSSAEYPREIPALPGAISLSGVSFSVATMTGFAARAREMRPDGSVELLKRLLIDSASK